MGFTRVLYNFLGLDYVGRYEQAIIERQTHLKHLMCRQIRDSYVSRKLNKTPVMGAYIYTQLKRVKKKKQPFTTSSIINKFKTELP